MVKIISLIIKLLNIINKFSFKLECFLMQFLPKDPSTIVDSEPYKRFKVDLVPVIKPESMPITLEQAIEDYKAKHNGKEPKPINRRTELTFSKSTKCPHCGAPHEYIFDNRSGKKSIQLRCKICDTTFSPNKVYSQQVAHYCPYCGNKLHVAHERSGYTVYKCMNHKCSLYRTNYKKLTKAQKKEHKLNPHKFTLHYITRIFDGSINQLENFQKTVRASKVELRNIRSNRHVLGLILTYYINYGLSLRKTALIMREVHDISISHQTVANYAEAVSHLIEPWLDNYQYDHMSKDHCGDETYVKVKGKHAYVFFMCDSISKIITSFNIFMKRDTFSAIKTFYSVIRKFKAIPEGLNFVVDGNPIYKAAQQYFQLQGMNFDVHQVIGLKNSDATSKKFRPAKQIIERLNRTFQFSYYVKNGFSTIDKANEFMYLFTTYFNFLRNHKTLGYKPPVLLPKFKGVTNMPKKWNMIIDLAYDYDIEQDMQF